MELNIGVMWAIISLVFYIIVSAAVIIYIFYIIKELENDSSTSKASTKILLKSLEEDIAYLENQLKEEKTLITIQQRTIEKLNNKITNLEKNYKNDMKKYENSRKMRDKHVNSQIKTLFESNRVNYNRLRSDMDKCFKNYKELQSDLIAADERQNRRINYIIDKIKKIK